MTRVRFAATALALLLCGVWAVADQTPQAPTAAPAGQGPPGRGPGGRGGPPRVRTRKVVLAWADTRNGIAQHDSVSHALAVIERLGYESGAYDTYIRTDSNIVANEPKMTTGAPASGGPSLANVDAIFFLGHRDVPLDQQQKDGTRGVRARRQGLRRRARRADRVRFVAGVRRPARRPLRRSSVEHGERHGDQRRSFVPGDQALRRRRFR